MKNLGIVMVVLTLASCGQETTPPSLADDAISTTVSPDPGEMDTAISAGALPDFSQYPGVCPKDWGIVIGAPQAHVEKFIQNYFYVPKGGPSPMYSEINTFAAPGGATVIKAGTYKILDPIVDQEMVSRFVAGKMTHCGSRLRCQTDPDTWVASCD